MARVTKSLQDTQKQLVIRIARDGSSIDKICEESGVPRSTLFDWYEDPVFFESFQAARCKGERVNKDRVADSLFRAAMGYVKDLIKILPDGSAMKIPVEVAADIKAAIFVLSSLEPEKWSGDKQKVEVSGDLSKIVILPDNGRRAEIETCADPE